MALTPEQIELRKKLVGGSDTNIILGGNEEKILKLWRVKRGEEESENLDDVLPVQMGTFTEPFNAQWFTKQTGRALTNQGESRTSMDYHFMGCTLDGLTDDGQTVWEAKHVSAFAKEDEILERYMPQLHHNMIVTGLERAVLSVFFGNHKWERFEVSKDPAYSAALIEAVRLFWDCVETGRSPVAIEVKAPMEATLRLDMTGNNEWAVLAAQYLDNAKYNKMFDDAAKGLKNILTEDVAEAYGHGISIKRDKRGALRIKGA
jgi:predicted phage-related endonuclease